jgi:hypothetical protein
MKIKFFDYGTLIILFILIVGVVSIQALYGGIRLSEYPVVPFYVKRKLTTAPSVVSGVPLVIYQSWQTNSVPDYMYSCIKKLIAINPEFDYYLYSDDASRKFIKNNFDREVLNAFDSLKPGAYKSDLWRYCVLYKRGGVYLDIKYFSLVPLINIIEKNPIIYVKDRQLGCNNSYTGLYNAFIVSPPGNSIFKYCINDIIDSCKFKLYRTSFLDITGPCLLGRIVNKYNSDNYINDLKFYHVFNNHEPISIYFGDLKIIEAYPEYRHEQRIMAKTEHYSVLWNNEAVYI